MQKESVFYQAGRGDRGVPRTQFHVLLDQKTRKKLVALSRKMRLSGADVVRHLIEAA